MDNSSAFKSWFGKSVIVTDDGEPKVVYHGSGHKFDAFDLNKIGKVNGRSEGAGFYFTDNKSIAGGYASGGHLYEAYLRMEKPLPIDSKKFSKVQLSKLIKKCAELESSEDDMDIKDGFLSNIDDTYSNKIDSVILKASNQLFEYNKTAMDQLGDLIGMGVNAHIVNEALHSTLGYDGYVSKGFGNAGTDGSMIYVCMFPWQIKSTSNKGTWNIKSNNIMENEQIKLMGLAESCAFDVELEEGFVSKAIGIASILASAVMGKVIKAPSDVADAFGEVKTEQAKKALVAVTIAQDIVGGGDIFGEVGAKLTKSIGKTAMDEMSDFMVDLTLKPVKDKSGVHTNVIPSVGSTADEAKEELAKSLEFAQGAGEDISKLGDIVIDEVTIGGMFSKQKYFVAYPKNGRKTSMFKNLMFSLAR